MSPVGFAPTSRQRIQSSRPCRRGVTVAKGSLRRYDTQAKVSLYAAVASFLGMMVLAYMLQRNLIWETKLIVYKSQFYMPLVLLLTAGTLLMAAAAIAIGANSAGQRRNEKSRLSWTGFFIGAVTLSLTIIMFYGFYTAKVSV